MTAAAGFHDGYIEKITDAEDEVQISFKGLWGCDLDVKLQGDVEYKHNDDDLDNPAAYWYGATILSDNGTFYLIDDYEMTLSDIKPYHCWFKGKKMTYRIMVRD